MSVASETLLIEKAVYGGDGLAHTAAGKVVLVPFALPGEEVRAAEEEEGTDRVQVLQPSTERVAPACVHFGVCGGCQYQMASYPEQLRMKQAILQESLLRGAPRADLPEMQVLASPEPWGYRNRIRLRVRQDAGALRLGYLRRGSQSFLPIEMCPIAAPVLWSAAKAFMELAAADAGTAQWLGAAAELELQCDAEGTAVQAHLLCLSNIPPWSAAKGKPKRQANNGSDKLEAVRKRVVALQIPLISLGASRLHTASGRALEALATSGQDGLAYPVGEERFWLKRGSFFQVNRFLLPAMVATVLGVRRGRLAWDLFAGVGLFARALTRRFEQVTAVEASPLAVEELRRGLARSAGGASHRVHQQTTATFLRGAALQRERPELVVLDPPRAGAGAEVTAQLLHLAPATIVYVSCDPTTLARDLEELLTAYRVAELYMVDLFPQTYHLETVMVLERLPVEG